MKEIKGKLEIIEKEPPNKLNIEDCKIIFDPKILIYPSFAATVTELSDKLNKMKKMIKIKNNSTIILKNNVIIEQI